MRTILTVISVYGVAILSTAMAVIVITDLDFGRIPQPPRTNESDLVHVRVTSGRLGGRFFYRVSETGLPGDLPSLMIPFGFYYHQSPYTFLPRPASTQQTPPPLPSPSFPPPSSSPSLPPPSFPSLPHSASPASLPPAPSHPFASLLPSLALPAHSTPTPPIVTTTDKNK